MFLVVVGHRVGNRMIQERFQHLGETVNILCVICLFEFVHGIYYVSRSFIP